MSGGADFEPASAQMTEAPEPATQQPDTPTVAATTSRTQPSAAIDTATITKITSSPDVTRAAVNLTSITEPENEVQAPEPAPSTAPERARITNSADTPQIILPSLIAAPDAGGATPYADIRSVTANRVNVRGGPSTNYGVVGKLERGAEVRILEDDGNGWVLMEPLDGGEQGWMADFLLTAG